MSAVRDAVPDRGSAVVEFLGVALVLLVPCAYLVLVLSAVQQATFAVEGAAREAARVLAAGPGPEVEARAAAAVGLALSDQGLTEVDPWSVLAVSCSGACGPGDDVEVTVRVEVSMPLVPQIVRDAVPARVPVEARHVAVIDPFVRP